MTQTPGSRLHTGSRQDIPDAALHSRDQEQENGPLGSEMNVKCGSLPEDSTSKSKSGPRRSSAYSRERREEKMQYPHDHGVCGGDSGEQSGHPDISQQTGPKESSSTPALSLSQQMSTTRELLFVFIICSSNILTQAGLGMTIAPLHLIGHSFGALNPGQLSWFVAAYSLTVGTFILIAGRLGDIFGHKLLFVAGFFWCGFWSLIVGFTVYSHSQIFFDISRALQGIGPAMMVPNSLALMGEAYPPGRRKEFVFSIYGATAPNGFICGAVFGSLIAQLSWWPWEFWVMGIACFALGITAILLVPSPPEPGLKYTKDSAFDLWGALAGVAGLVLFNVSWNQAPIVGWTSPYVLVFLILGMVFFGAFFVIEKRVSRPLIPMGALSGKAGFVLGCIAAGWSSFGIFVYYLFQFTENLRHVTPLEAASQVVPAGPAGICAALTTGYILSRVPTSMVMSISMLAFCTGNILLATMPIGQTYWIQTFLCLIIIPWGMDMSFPAATIILSDFVPPGHQGIAASLVVTVVNYSISIGLGIAGTVEVHVNQGGQNLLRGYRGAFYAAIGLSGLGFLFALWSAGNELRLRRRTKTMASSAHAA